MLPCLGEINSHVEVDSTLEYLLFLFIWQRQTLFPYLILRNQYNNSIFSCNLVLTPSRGERQTCLERPDTLLDYNDICS